MIKIDHVTYRYDEEHTALKDISLEINKGEMLAIVGHNGSGKSTLAKHLNALLLPTEGRVEVDGMDTAVEANTLNIRKKVGMVFQNPDNQIVTTIVEEDVAFGPENLGVHPEEIRRRVNESLKAVGMEKYARSAPHMLSGGQKQRIAIAGMLAGGATVFIWKLLVKPIGGVFGIYELLPAFIVSSVFIVAVSLLSPEPSEEIQQEFDRVKAGE